MADPLLREQFIAAMSRSAATVNVVTTDGPAGRAGATVSAMSSVSADTDKPTLLVCLHHESAAAQAALQNGVFCVNILRDDQSYISDTFAGRFGKDVRDKFDCAEWTTQSTGAPRVIDPLVAFDCRTLSAERVGTHHIFIGEVEDVFQAASGSPLIYSKRDYGRAIRIDPINTQSAGTQPQPAQLSIGCFHSFGPFVLPPLIAAMRQNTQTSLSLVEGDHRRVLESLRAGEVDLALIYDFDLGGDIEAHPLKDLPPYALMPADHPLAQKTPLSLADLAPHPMILLDGPHSTEYFTSLFADTGHSPNIAYRTGSIEMLRGLVGHGLGYSLLATRPSGDQTYDGKAIVTRDLSDTLAPSRLVVASRAGQPLSQASTEFLALCHELFGPEL